MAATSDVATSEAPTTGGPTPTTMTSTTMPGEDTMGTQGGTGMETTMGAVDTTMGVSVTDGETTTADPSTSGNTSSGGESSSGEPRPDCVAPADCPNNETCNVMGECESVCLGGWGMGSYNYCLNGIGVVDTPSLCGANHTCVVGGAPLEAATCTTQACTNVCDCGAPPPTGDAVVTCDNLTPGDMVLDCYLRCANGETCPDGMVCRTGTLDSYCAQPVQPLEMYGNCGGIAAPCISGNCASFGGNEVCVSSCPGGTGDCDGAPAGAGFAAACGQVFDPPGGNECHLPCNFSTDCPAGMVCIDIGMGFSDFCMWS